MIKTRKIVQDTEQIVHDKEWTVMIYMSGENNLSTEMVYSMERMRQAISDISNVNLFVYYDGATPDVPTLYCDFSDPKCEKKYYRAEKIKETLHTVDRKFDENSAAMYSIANFVDWCVNKVEYDRDGTTMRGRKANRYALIFSGHSLGFQNVGMLKDERSGYYMAMSKLRWLLSRLTMNAKALKKTERKRADDKNYEVDENSLRWKEHTTPVIGQKLDILGFDSCVMGMLEVGYQFRNAAKTLIASEGSIPNAGWSYAEILGSLSSRSKDDLTSDFARDFVRNFIQTQDRNTLGGVTVDMAAWDLAALDNIEDPFLAFANSLLACFDENNSRTTPGQMRRLLTYVHWKCQTYMLEQNVDLGDLCSLLIEEIGLLQSEGVDVKADKALLAQVVTSSRDLIEAMKAVILIHGFSGGKYQYSNGISLFFPWSLSSYNISKEAYNLLTFIGYRECGIKWNKFLALFVGDISLRRAKQIGVNNTNGEVYPNHKFAPDHIGGIAGLYGGDKIPVAGQDKIPVAGQDKIPVSGQDKIPVAGKDKLPVAGNDKLHGAAGAKIPVAATDKIPENASNKIFGATGEFFQQFMDCKNIQTFWNVSGLSESGTRVTETLHK